MFKNNRQYLREQYNSKLIAAGSAAVDSLHASARTVTPIPRKPEPRHNYEGYWKFDLYISRAG